MTSSLLHPGLVHGYKPGTIQYNMADIDESDKENREKVHYFATVDEDCIPGASLRGRKPEQLTVPELKRWLSCRKGASLKGRKADLVER